MKRISLIITGAIIASCAMSTKTPRAERLKNIDLSAFDSQWAELELKDCEGKPCANDPCAQRAPSMGMTLLEKAVDEFNAQVCKDRPWRGYLLTSAIVRSSVEQQLASLPANRQEDYTALLQGTLDKDHGLHFFSEGECTGFTPYKYFFPRLYVDDPQSDNVQVGYSLNVGKDATEDCANFSPQV